MPPAPVGFPSEKRLGPSEVSRCVRSESHSAQAGPFLSAQDSPILGCSSYGILSVDACSTAVCRAQCIRHCSRGRHFARVFLRLGFN